MDSAQIGLMRDTRMTIKSCGVGKVQSAKSWYKSLGQLSCTRTITKITEITLKTILNKLS